MKIKKLPDLLKFKNVYLLLKIIRYIKKYMIHFL